MADMNSFQRATDTTEQFTREPTPEAKITTKQKLKPSVTPRTFKRFFTPRTGSREGLRKRNRNALSELTPSGFNSAKQSFARKVLVDDETPENSPHGLSTWDQTRSSPIWGREDHTPSKRIKIDHVHFTDSVELIHDYASEDEDDSDLAPSSPKTVTRSRYRSSLGDCLRRQLSLGPTPQAKSTYSVYSNYDTAGYHSSADDIYINKGLGDRGYRSVIPFCSVACNTNSLVAVGDEDGVIRLLETTANSNRKFHDPLLSFKAHNNAILDLQFSRDDKLLATASGDQACQVIDMLTQKAVFQLKGHVSSVKQIRFQPGSNDSVLATSSRDGSIQIWDLRCNNSSQPATRIEVSLDGSEEDVVSARTPEMIRKTRTNLIDDAHFSFLPESSASQFKNTDRRSQPLQSRSEPSVTALSFLSASNPHILLSAADSQSIVKVWDIRSKYSSRRRTVPISTTSLPARHNHYRHFGITSMVVSPDATRLYTLGKDSTVYTYSTSHLTLGSQQNLFNDSVRPTRNPSENTSIGPIHAFRHTSLDVSTFYVKLSLRPAAGNRTELLALGSSKASPVLFPTDERMFKLQPPVTTNFDPFDSLERDIPVYNHGTALVRGHEREVTSVSWTNEGNLVSLSDDARIRVWRDDYAAAREMRGGREPSSRWGCGWAELDDEMWDEDDC